MNAIKKVIGTDQPHSQTLRVHRDNKETNKGLDIKLDANTNLLPNLGNNQDIKFTVLGIY